jgi:hypothetical protein
MPSLRGIGFKDRNFREFSRAKRAKNHFLTKAVNTPA